jgi:paraquat-inducible protein A
MQTYPALIACVNCDTISERPALARGQQACCAACGAVLLRSGLNVRQLLALALAAAVVFVIANVYPVIGIGLYGEHHRTTLLGSALSLADSRAAPIAIVVVMAIVVLPALQIAVLCWLLLFARAGRRAPLFGVLMRAWEQLNPWSMIEVGMLAILVSVVKLRGLMHVEIGIGIWAMAALVVLLLAVIHRDIRSLWSEIEGGEA